MKQADLMKVIEAPVISEKCTLGAERDRRVAFKVFRNSSKDQIRRAVELLFKVEVESVQVLNVRGKEKRFGRFKGARSDWKKAYVKLKPGFDIDFNAA
jgi:large subunit ribosomal protein L23